MTTFHERTWTFDSHPKGEGPWQNEPDKVQWVDEATGLDCLMVRGPLGSWCGYVGLPRQHPLYGVEYSHCPTGCEHYDEHGYCDHEPAALVDVHGGLTFSDRCHEGRGDQAICHVPYEGRDGDVWWFGFDTAHSGDAWPKYSEPPLSELAAKYPEVTKIGTRGTYRDVDYVRREVTMLAHQLAQLP